MRFISQTSASFVSNWEAGPQQCTDKHKVIHDQDLELDELKPNQSSQPTAKKSKKANNKNSSPVNNKCLIYRDGQIERFKGPVIVVTQNGSQSDNQNHKQKPNDKKSNQT